MEEKLNELSKILIDNFAKMDNDLLKYKSKLTMTDIFIYLIRLSSDEKASANSVTSDLLAENLCNAKVDAFKKKRLLLENPYLQKLFDDLLLFYYLNFNRSIFDNKLFDDYIFIASDCTSTQISKNLKDEGYSTSKGEKYCDVLFSGCYDVQNDLIYDLEPTKMSSDIKALETHYNQIDTKLKNIISLIKKKPVLILDRAYYASWVLHDIKSLDADVIFRLKSDDACVLKLLKSRRKDDTFDVLLNDKVVKLRVITYTIRKQKYFIGTTLLNKKIFTILTLRNLYGKRWSIEESFKVCKNELSLRFFHSKSENLIKQETIIHKIIILLTRIIEETFIKYSNFEMNNKQTNFIINVRSLIKHILPLLIYPSKFDFYEINRLISNMFIKCFLKEKRYGRKFKRKAIKPRTSFNYMFGENKDKTNKEKKRGKNNKKKRKNAKPTRTASQIKYAEKKSQEIKDNQYREKLLERQNRVT